MKKCYLYLRVSSERQVQGDGLDRQESMLIKYFNDNAEAQDFDPEYELIIDKGLSAFKAEHLHDTAGLGRFFAQVREGLIEKGSVLLVESLDRFSRENPFKCVQYLSELDRSQIELIDVSKNLPIGRKYSNSLSFAMMVAERAYEESKIKSERISKGWNSRRLKSKENGHYMIKNCPPWISVIDDKYVLNEKYTIVREIFDLYLSGIRSYSIAIKLNEEQKYISNTKWDGTKICRILRNERCKGNYTTNRTLRNFDDDSVTKTTEIIKIYPPIVSEEEFAEVKRRLDNHNYLGRVKNEKKKTVFNGLLKCFLCGEAMTVSTTNGYTYLKCNNARFKKGCTGSLMSYPPFEKGILQHLKDIDLSNVVNDKNNRFDEFNILKGEVQDLESYLSSFIDGIERIKSAGRMPSFDMLDQKQQAEDKLKILKEKLQQKKELATVQNLEFNDSIYNIENVVERTRLELELHKAIKKINVLSERKNKYFFLADILYFNDDYLKHSILIDKKSGCTEIVIEITKQNGERSYKVQERGCTVFEVHSNGDVWVLYASRSKNIGDIIYCMNLLRGREPDKFEFVINEDMIEWLD